MSGRHNNLATRCSEESRSTKFCEQETFHNYVERMVHFFWANSIIDENMKSVFLAVCGAKTYENLCLPQEVSDIEYGKIIDKVKTHFKPEPLIIL